MSSTGVLSSILVCIWLAILAGCGGSSNVDCTEKLTSISIDPASATLDHLATPPANSKQFQAFNSTPDRERPGCVYPAVVSPLSNVTWTVSDPVNVTLATTNSGGLIHYVTATCVGRTDGPAILTGTVDGTEGAKVSNTASLTCQ